VRAASAARSLGPGVLFGVSSIALLVLGGGFFHDQRAVAERSARERLRGRATEAASGLATVAERLLREAATGPTDAEVSPDGVLLRPPPSVVPPPLRPVTGRDPEGDFYLAEAERAEVAGEGPERARGLYAAAAGPDRDPRVRSLALFRVAALERRAGNEAAAGEREDGFLRELPAEARSTREALIARARRRPPDEDLSADLLRAVGGRWEPEAIGLARHAGLETAGPVAARRKALVLRERMDGMLPRIDAAPAGVMLAGERLVAWSRDGEGILHLREGSLPAVPPGVRYLVPGEEPPEGPDLAVTVPAGEVVPGIRITAREPLAVQEAEAARGAALLVGAYVILLLAGSGSLFVALRAARRERDAARERTAFVTRVGHDLRTPLTLIRMYAETVASGRARDPAEARTFAGVAAREAERLTGLVGSVLDLSRVSEGESPAVRRDLDMVDLVEEVVAFHRPLLDNAGLRVVVEPGGPLPVRVDAAALRGAVSNLLENAVRHAATGGEVGVRILAEGGTALLEVRDRGPGIPPGWEERVFERFVRGPGTPSTGSGLGLALVREVAEAHGGSATAAARDGGGAVFTVRLPLRGGAP